MPEPPRNGSDPVVLCLSVDASAIDEVEAQLWMLGTTGIATATADDGGRVGVDAGFASAEEAAAALTALGEKIRHHRVMVPDGSELDTWRAFATSVNLADGLTVVVVDPTDGPRLAKPEPHEVWIDPGRSFGYGAHPTSRLAMEAVAELSPGVLRLLDFGSGSGVVGIVGLLRGAQELVAVDNDPEARRCTSANAALNNLSHRMDAPHHDLATAEGPFDLVVANVEAPVLEDLLADLCDRVGPAGTLVLGGILETRWPSLRQQLARTARAHEVVAAPVLEGWIGPVVQLLPA